MLSLVDVALDSFSFCLTAPKLAHALVIHELGNPGVRVDGLVGRQLLRRRSGSTGGRELFEGGLGI